MNRGGIRSLANPIKYAFIDGAYLDELRIEVGMEFFGAPLDLNYKLFKQDFQKVFYYDCLPAQKGAESADDYARRRAEREKHFDLLRSYDGWHVSEGTGKWNKKRGSSQKEVDILIAVEMLTHTYRRNMDQLTFIAGDLDFRPLLEAVVSDGMYVNLWYGPKSTSRELRNAADSKEALDVFRLYTLCTERFRSDHPFVTKSGSTSGVINARKIVSIAMREGFEAAWLEEIDNGVFRIWAAAEPSAPVPLWIYSDGPLEQLKRVHALCHPGCEWKV